MKQWIGVLVLVVLLVIAYVLTQTSAPPTFAKTAKATPVSDGTVVPRSVYANYHTLARYDAQQAGIDPTLFERQIQQESGFNPLAISPAGAIGIAQFMPATAKGLGINPYDPISSLQGAARYMARLVASYQGSYAKALAAYNAGPGAVTYAVNHGGVSHWRAWLPLETQNYVSIIMGG
jgi:soluble lytic murein transglycosylase-like protein